MKLLFTTDLHGKKHKYDTVLDFAIKHKVQAVINGGDMLPAYYRIHQGEFIQEVLRPFFYKLSTVGIAHFGMLGNDDLNTFDKLFERTCKEFPNVFDIAQKMVLWEGLEILGMNHVKDYPYQFKDKCRLDRPGDNPFDIIQRGEAFFSNKDGSIRELRIEEYLKLLPTLQTLEQILNELPKPTNWSKTIFVSHDPPWGLGLDLTDSYEQVGSKAVLSYIETHQPLLSLHGHIHGSFYTSGITVADVDNTRCIQPGQRYEQCRIALIDLTNLNVEILEI